MIEKAFAVCVCVFTYTISTGTHYVEGLVDIQRIINWFLVGTEIQDRFQIEG